MSEHVAASSARQPANSPFTPGYGKQPVVFGGHRDAIEEFASMFKHYDFGENQSILISGLRGAGKTSMLGVLQDLAHDAGWITIRDDASKGLMDRVMSSTIPAIVNRLQTKEEIQVRSLSVLQVGVELETVDNTRTVKPLLRDDLLAISEATGYRGILILVDEVHSGKVRLRELSRFALEVSHAIAEGANIVVAFAGVKIDLDELLKQPHTTFLRRSRELDFRRLTPADTASVLRETVETGGRLLSPDAEARLVAISQGYPYLVQLAGDYAWRHNPSARTITLADADAAHTQAIRAVNRRVISRIYLDLSEKDQAFLRAMAHDDGRTKISSIVNRMGVSDQYVQVYKQRLIDSGYVQGAGHGYVEFSLPYLRDYVRSTTDIDRSGPDHADAWRDYPPPAP
ncbi:MAG: hypothetical protein QM658_11525 [Gordonia sp. (in: high G+C Gram-positive bacteria)]